MEKDLYFKDEEAKYIFYLVEIGGRIQMNLLGIKRIHYINKDIAKSWYEEINNKIKNSKHPKAVEAVKQLENLYKGMKW